MTRMLEREAERLRSLAEALRTSDISSEEDDRALARVLEFLDDACIEVEAPGGAFRAEPWCDGVVVSFEWRDTGECRDVAYIESGQPADGEPYPTGVRTFAYREPGDEGLRIDFDREGR